MSLLDLSCLSVECLSEIDQGIAFKKLREACYSLNMALSQNKTIHLTDEEASEKLRNASEEGRLSIVKIILRERSHIIDIAIYNNTILSCRSVGVRVSIRNSVIQDNEGRTALMWASSRGHKEIVKLLLKYNANVDIQDSDEWTALMWASLGGHKEIVKLLLEDHNANVDIQDSDGWTALMIASSYGHKEIVKVLLDHNAKIDIQSNYYGVTALMWASRNGHKEVVKVLLDHNANVDIQDNDGWTALMYASRHGYEKIVKLLS